MSRSMRENPASRWRSPSLTDIHPSLMVIPSYAQLQQERAWRRDIIKARFNNALNREEPCTLRSRSSCTQTSLCSIQNDENAKLRSQLASQDNVIYSLNKKVLQIEKLNTNLHLQLIESSFAHTDKDQDISNLKSELAKANSEINRKDIYLVDYNRAKKSEAKMVAQLAKQHLVIVRLTQDLNSCRSYISLMCQNNPDDDWPSSQGHRDRDYR